MVDIDCFFYSILVKAQSFRLLPADVFYPGIVVNLFNPL